MHAKSTRVARALGLALVTMLAALVYYWAGRTGAQTAVCSGGGDVDLGVMNVGDTRSATVCGPWTGTVSLTKDGQPAGTKIANGDGSTTVTVSIISQTQANVDDVVPTQCGRNTVVVSGSGAQGVATRNVFFEVSCAGTNAFIPAAAFAASVPFGAGDVFVSLGDFDGGTDFRVVQSTGSGSLKSSFDATNSSPSGACFDQAQNLLVTEFHRNEVRKFDAQGTSSGTPAFLTGFQRDPESCVVDQAGNIYVGEADGDRLVTKFNAAGNRVATFAPAPGDRGADWIDLAADQCTLFYTSEGSSVKRFNVCTNTQLSDFATGLTTPGPSGTTTSPSGSHTCYSLHIRPNGEVVVACAEQVVRLDSAGMILKTYPNPENDVWFASNLDPDKTSLWTVEAISGVVRRIDIDSGATLASFTVPSFSPGKSQTTGLAVVGELIASQPTSTTTTTSATLPATRPGPPPPPTFSPSQPLPPNQSAVPPPPPPPLPSAPAAAPSVSPPAVAGSSAGSAATPPARPSAAPSPSPPQAPTPAAPLTSIIPPPAQVQAQVINATPSLKVDRRSAAPGDDAIASGTGCPAGSSVRLQLEGQDVGSATADDRGSFKTHVLFPQSALLGEREVIADCAGQTLRASITLALSTAVVGAPSGPIAAMLAFFILIGLILFTVRSEGPPPVSRGGENPYVRYVEYLP